MDLEPGTPGPAAEEWRLRDSQETRIFTHEPCLQGGGRQFQGITRRRDPGFLCILGTRTQRARDLDRDARRDAIQSIIVAKRALSGSNTKSETVIQHLLHPFSPLPPYPPEINCPFAMALSSWRITSNHIPHSPLLTPKFTHKGSKHVTGGQTPGSCSPTFFSKIAAHGLLFQIMG